MIGVEAARKKSTIAERFPARTVSDPFSQSAPPALMNNGSKKWGKIRWTFPSILSKSGAAVVHPVPDKDEKVFVVRRPQTCPEIGRAAPTDIRPNTSPEATLASTNPAARRRSSDKSVILVQQQRSNFVMTTAL
jgi:hypothetical protein